MGKIEPLSVSSRTVLQNSKAAMNNDIIAGLIELITNSDDSLCKLEKEGTDIKDEIQIFVKRSRGEDKKTRHNIESL